MELVQSLTTPVTGD